MPTYFEYNKKESKKFTNKSLYDVIKFYIQIFSRRIYRNFIIKLEQYRQSGDLKNTEDFIQTQIYESIIENHPQWNTHKIKKILSLIHQFIFINEFLFVWRPDYASKYEQGNYSIVDFINQYVQKNLNHKDPKKIFSNHKLLFEKSYNYGCNCICRTAIFGALFTILNEQHIFPEYFEKPNYFTQIDEASFHIFFGIRINDSINDEKTDYFYVENTSNPVLNFKNMLMGGLMPRVPQNFPNNQKSIFLYYCVEDHFINCYQKYSVIDTFTKEEAPLYMIILDEYFNRNIEAFKVWYEEYAIIFRQYFTLFNRLILRKQITTLLSLNFQQLLNIIVEMIYRTFEELKKFPNSEKYWKDYDIIFVLLENLDNTQLWLLLIPSNRPKYKRCFNEI
jgi:hypothetical protein